MATVSLSLDKATYVKGDTITATYTVGDVDPIVGTLTGVVTVDGVAHPASADVRIEHVIQFSAPTGVGLSFAATADPRAWTATA